MAKEPLKVNVFENVETDPDKIGVPFFGFRLVRVDQLKSLGQDRDTWRAKYNAVQEDMVTIDHKNEAVVISTKVLENLTMSEKERNAIVLKLSADVEFYKQKYADEVQKRLELMKHIDHIEISPGADVTEIPNEKEG